MTKASEILIDTAKTIIGINSAGIVFVAAFKKDFFANSLLPWSIGAYVVVGCVSIIISLSLIMTCAGKEEIDPSFSIYDKPVRFLSYGMVFSLLFSMILLAMSVFEVSSVVTNPAVQEFQGHDIKCLPCRLSL